MNQIPSLILKGAIPVRCVSVLPGIGEVHEAVVLIHEGSQDVNKVLTSKPTKVSFHLHVSLGILECVNIYL